MSVLRSVQATATQDGTLTYYEISLSTVHGLHGDRYGLLYVVLCSLVPYNVLCVILK